MSFPPSAAPLDDVERVLVITAHPDDVDFGAAGTVAAFTDAGLKVAYCVATRGDAGGFDDTPRAGMPTLREAEQRAAAAAVGVTDVTFLDHPDGALCVTHELRRDLTREIRRFRPTGSAPSRRSGTGSGSAPATRTTWPSARPPSAPGSDHPVDITDTFDRKLAALAEHRSQTGHVTGLAERLRGYLTENAPTAGLPDGRLAELFTIVRTS